MICREENIGEISKNKKIIKDGGFFAMSFGEFQWVEIVYGLIGSFVGLFLALFADGLIKKQEEMKKITTLIETIIQECKSVECQIKESWDKDMLFSTFIWDSITSTDFFPVLLHEEQETCRILIQVYSNLNALRELQNRGPEDVCDYEKTITKIKGEILAHIAMLEK